MSRPLITALIDTYNHESFIEEALSSVIEQDFPASEMEVLVVDDGSTDHTPALVRKFEPRARLLRKSNGGQGSAFNAGIPEARGEIIAFLDGDDWWARNKLTAVAEAFAGDRVVGLVGHAITHVEADGTQHVEAPREVSQFRIVSAEQARTFRMRKNFLGTSRMAYRKEVLEQIGRVPEELKFEADEYLFTLAGFFADVMILREPLTFYRLHGGNLFQVADGKEESVRKKQGVLVALAGALGKKFAELGIAPEISQPIVECVQVEADLLRLALEGGYPWETVSTELKIMRVFHRDASLPQQMFSLARLLPALVMPAGSYYRWRSRLSRMEVYRNLRQRFFPFPVPSHVERQEKQGP